MNGMTITRRALASIAVAFFALAPAHAEELAPATSRHEIRIDGRRLAYTAEAGRIPIRDDATGEAHGHIFYVSYRLPARRGETRPVAFIWNGGPGANSTLLHFEAFGPRVFSGDALIDNVHTLLPYADMVFVDPIGTGFSRPTREEYEAEFYSTLGDHASIAEFVRVWRLRNNAQDAPVFLMGESFGTWRAGGVAQIMESRGDHVAGTVLISGGAAVGPNALPREVATAARIPGRAAAAFAHGRMQGADRESVVREAEAWAMSRYLPALQRLSSLSASERAEIASELAQRTGLRADQVDPQTLALTPRVYLTTLIPEQRLDTFDMRIAAENDANPTRARVIDRYLRQELGYRTDLAYAGLDLGYTPANEPTPQSINARWNYNSGEITPEVMASAMAGEGPPGAQPWSIETMRLNPNFKVMVAAGLYDSLNSCLGNRELEQRLDPQFARNFSMRCYWGGHMMYRDAPEHARLTADVAAFIASATR
jgi:carboxypeptidase C (cathepsin A)